MSGLLDVFEHRRTDYAFDAHQNDLLAAGSDLAQQTMSAEQVMHPSGQSAGDGAYEALRRFGALSMPVPIDLGGDGASAVDLVALAEALGAGYDGGALVEAMVGVGAIARALTATGDAATRAMLASVLDGDSRVFFNPRGRDAPCVEALNLAWRDGSLIVVGQTAMGHDVVHQLAAGPTARDVFTSAKHYWRVLMGATMVSMASHALDAAVRFASERTTRGCAIGSLQGIAYQLVDVHIELNAARNLLRKAAWYCENEPAEHPDLPALAFITARRSVLPGLERIMHVQGAQGVSLETTATLAFDQVLTWTARDEATAHLLADIGRRAVLGVMGRERRHG